MNPFRTHRHPVNVATYDQASSADRIADRVMAFLGSWRFLAIQTVIVGLWIAANVWQLSQPFDPYPFILLNLAFSTQAAYAAPLILLAGNRQQLRDRLTLEHTSEEADIAEKQNEELLLGNRRLVEQVAVLEQRILQLEQNILTALREEPKY
ncbi:MAG: DUF1003 domain-containing protein [Candidatus Limnocylindrales bacterium]